LQAEIGTDVFSMNGFQHNKQSKDLPILALANGPGNKEIA